MWWVVVIFILAGLVHGAAGFGLPLVAAPLLIEHVGIQVSSPLIALVVLALAPLFLWRYRRSVNLRHILPIIVMAFIGIPIGLYILETADIEVISRLLGLLLSIYALYAWFTPELPELNNPLWPFIFGLIAGIISGAYAVGGIIVVIFATCRRWAPGEFKGNMQLFFLLSNIFLVASHGVSGNLTPVVTRSFLFAFPAAVVGLFLGFALDPFSVGPRFRQLVLILIFILGLRLLLAG